MLKCPKCGSENVEETGFSHDSGVGDLNGNIAWQRKQSGYRCRDCGECFSAPAAERKQ
jgi:transposase-like protein